MTKQEMHELDMTHAKTRLEETRKMLALAVETGGPVGLITDLEEEIHDIEKWIKKLTAPYSIDLKFENDKWVVRWEIYDEVLLEHLNKKGVFVAAKGKEFLNSELAGVYVYTSRQTLFERNLKYIREGI